MNNFKECIDYLTLLFKENKLHKQVNQSVVIFSTLLAHFILWGVGILLFRNDTLNVQQAISEKCFRKFKSTSKL